jgi:adhesin transport system outer membrane protein
MKSLRMLPVFIGFLVNVLTVNAEEVSPSCLTPFGELLSEGLRTHPSITVSEKLILASELQLSSANWAYYPTPKVNMSGSLSNTRTTITIDQPLWDGGRIDASYSNAEAQKEEAFHSHALSQYQLIEGYVDTLKNYIQARDRITILSGGLQQLESIMGTIDRMIAVDELGVADKNLLNTKISDINSRLTIANAEFDVAKIQFEILTGNEISCDVVLTENSIFNDDMDIAKMVEDLLNFHPALRVFDAKIESAQSGVSSANSILWPTLMLRAEHKSGALYDNDSRQDETLLYLALEMSTGAGASALSDVERSKINVLKVKNQKLAKEKQVVDSLMNNYVQLVAVKNNIKIVSNDVDVAEQVLNSNKRMFFLEQKRWIDVVNALLILNNKKINKFKLLQEYKALEMTLALKTNRLSLETGAIL